MASLALRIIRHTYLPIIRKWQIVDRIVTLASRAALVGKMLTSTRVP